MSYPENYQPETGLLDGRVILVTGAGNGIGRAVAKACARYGAQVILLGKTTRPLEQVHDEIEAECGQQPAIYPLHLEGASPADYATLSQTLCEHYGKLDGLVHNAAALPYLSRIKDYEPEDWLKVMQTNLNAPFLMSQALLPVLEASSDASVIFTSDERIAGKPFWGAYAASKAGSDVLADLWAKELSNTAVRVNRIDPGPTLTSLRKRVYPGEDNTTIKSPERLANLYLWLLGPNSQSYRGQCFRFHDA